MSLQAELGDFSAVVLGSVAPDGKANFVAAFSAKAVASGLQVSTGDVKRKGLWGMEFGRVDS